MGAPKIRSYPPSTNNSDSHLTHTKHHPTLSDTDRSPHPLPTYTINTTVTQTQIHVQNLPCSHMIGKTQTESSYPLIHSPTTHTTPSNINNSTRITVTEPPHRVPRKPHRQTGGDQVTIHAITQYITSSPCASIGRTRQGWAHHSR